MEGIIDWIISFRKWEMLQMMSMEYTVPSTILGLPLILLPIDLIFISFIVCFSYQSYLKINSLCCFCSASNSNKILFVANPPAKLVREWLLPITRRQGIPGARWACLYTHRNRNSWKEPYLWLLRRDVSDATSWRNFFRIDGEVTKKDWNPQALNRKNAFLLNTFCVFLKKIRWNLLNSLKWANYESFTSIEIMIWQQSQFLQYAYVCCQTTLLCSKDTITTRNNNRYIGIIYIK